MFASTTSLEPQHGTDRTGALSLGVPLLCLWLLGLATFSLPGRGGPMSVGSLDLVAMVKLGSRALVLILLTAVLWRSRLQPRAYSALPGIVPFGLFLGWAILSTLWSPLKAVSFGQAGSLAAQLMLAGSLAVRWNGPADTARIVKHLALLLLLVSTVLIAVYLAAPQLAGMDRHAGTGGDTGLMHPTSAGATASLGIVLLLAARLIWNWRWTRWLIAPGLLVHSSVLLVAASRTALALTALFVVAMVALLTSRFAFGALVVAVSVAVGGYLVLDPGLEAVAGAIDSTATFLERGESEDQWRSFNGRSELWEIVWREFRKSPVRGCGYFVTSRTGAIDVWDGGPSNLTAHNVLLQVLVSTGLVGLALFAWALAAPAWRVLRAALVGMPGRGIIMFLLLVWAWFSGWGQLCSSFMGPIAPETVVFYSLLGLALTLCPAHRDGLPSPRLRQALRPS